MQKFLPIKVFKSSLKLLPKHTDNPSISLFLLYTPISPIRTTILVVIFFSLITKHALSLRVITCNHFASNKYQMYKTLPKKLTVVTE